MVPAEESIVQERFPALALQCLVREILSPHQCTVKLSAGDLPKGSLHLQWQGPMFDAPAHHCRVWHGTAQPDPPRHASAMVRIEWCRNVGFQSDPGFADRPCPPVSNGWVRSAPAGASLGIRRAIAVDLPAVRDSPCLQLPTGAASEALPRVRVGSCDPVRGLPRLAISPMDGYACPGSGVARSACAGCDRVAVRVAAGPAGDRPDGQRIVKSWTGGEQLGGGDQRAVAGVRLVQ